MPNKVEFQKAGIELFEALLLAIYNDKYEADVSRLSREICKDVLEGLRNGGSKGMFPEDAQWLKDLPTGEAWFKWKQVSKRKAFSPILKALDAVVSLIVYFHERSPSDRIRQNWLTRIPQSCFAHLATKDRVKRCLYLDTEADVLEFREIARINVLKTHLVGPFGDRAEWQSSRPSLMNESLKISDQEGLQARIIEKLKEDFAGSSRFGQVSRRNASNLATQILTEAGIAKNTLLVQEYPAIGELALVGKVAQDDLIRLRSVQVFHVATLFFSLAVVATIFEMRKHGISVYLDYSFMSGGDLAARLYQDHPFDFLITGEPGMHLTSNSEVESYRYMFQVFESPQYLVYRGSENRQKKQILYVPGISTEEAVRLGNYSETAQLDFDEAIVRVHHLEEGQGLILWSHARNNIARREDVGYRFKEVQKFRNSFYCHNEYCKEEWRAIRDSFCSVFISCWVSLNADSEKALRNIMNDRPFLAHFADLSSP